MTDQELKEIRERCDKATPGPWTIEPRDVYFYPNDSDKPILTQQHVLNYSEDFLGADVVGPVEPGRASFVVHDAWFIAHAREDIPNLLDEVERLKAELEDARKENYADDMNFLADKLIEVRVENDRLKESLKFYADKRNYEPVIMQVNKVDVKTKTIWVGSSDKNFEWSGAVDGDCGKRAREALEGDEK